MSTLHSAVLGGGTEKRTPAFDLRSWQGLTLVLKAGKESLREPGAYAEFRDLVLQYAQQGGDAEIKRKIDAIIANFPPLTETVPVRDEEGSTASEESDAHGESAPQVGRRVQPRFGVSMQNSTTEPLKHTAPAEIVPSPPTPVEHDPAPDERTAPGDTRQPSTHTPQEISQSEPVQSYEHKTLDEYKTRIAEIKRSVHERVGNPVALMGMENGIGKTYMTALLNALKATGAGGSPNVDATMRALEDAYATLVAAHEDAGQPKTDSEVQAQPREEAPQDIVQHIAPVSEPAVVEPSPEVSFVPDAVSEQPHESTEEFKTEEVHSENEQTGKEDMLRSSFEKSDNIISAVVGAVQRKKYVERESSAPLIVDDSTVAEPDAEAKHVQREGLQDISRRPVSLAHEIGFPENKHTVKNLGADPSYANVKQSELFSQEITSYLDTLLHEWSIFSGSGIFGTGPGGLEHPLFATLAPLSMGEVIAGRWEGTNPKTLKIIKEYVDAWRHEQGITYTANETFEHYLRRVVERILKRRAA